MPRPFVPASARPSARLAVAALALAACAGLASSSLAADLKVGDAAPPLKVGKWVKGEPVSSIEADKTYVIECWATWCGPCIQAIPHVTELQQKHKDVVFIGANVWERDETKVEPFVQKMGDKMGYRVVMDDKTDGGDGALATTWLRAAGQNGIPCSFIVHNGKIAWIGHPMAMEKVLDGVVDGTFDQAAAKKLADDEAARETAGEKIQAEFTATVGPLVRNKDFVGAAKAINGLADKYPQMKDQLLGVKFGMLLQGKAYDEAYAAADQIAAASDDDAEQLNALAWTIVDQEGIDQRDFDRAEKYATRAAELTEMKEPAILDTLARVHAEKGHFDKAIEVQTKAVEFAGDDLKAELTATLEGYKSKLAK